MTIKYHDDLIQGSEDWMAARCGLLTASEMKLILTPTLKAASNDKERAHLWELLAQRITSYVEPQYYSDDMMRGYDDEDEARKLYSKAYAPATEMGFVTMGFVTNDEWGFTLGFSPDGLVGDDGFIECKSRRQRFQIETIVENVTASTIPQEFMLQIQTGFLVTKRAWCDFISFSGGLPMATIRVMPDATIMFAILEAAAKFETRLAEKMKAYRAALASKARLIPTERRIEQDIRV
jgi:hypothetical protein